MAVGTERFAFGQNWASFIERHFDEERVAITQAHLLKFLGRDSLEGSTFLDIGCGSGLHSLAAVKAGAKRVVSFDYDPMSVATTARLRLQAGEPAHWQVMHGSVLDPAFLATLGEFDIVYSWGVLHHTGDQWNAIRNAASRIGPGGAFYIALYTSDVFTGKHDAAFWLRIKKRYVDGGWLTKRSLELWYASWQLAAYARGGKNPISYVVNYRASRGMSYYHDVKDWVGGWPMEFSSVDEVKRFGAEALGLQLANIATGEANSEYLFTRAAETAVPADPVTAYLERCRAEWQALDLVLTDQQRFELAEALAGMVNPGQALNTVGR
ncbi:MAG TPA: class I SAM-dependent methyltransferase [Aliidongia sp.]|nr:class I SAM-dependent methyltransferase [Aliidongia sp.]